MRLRTTLFVALVTLSSALNASPSAEIKKTESAGWIRQRLDGSYEWVPEPTIAILIDIAAVAAGWNTPKAPQPEPLKSKAPGTPWADKGPSKETELVCGSAMRTKPREDASVVTYTMPVPGSLAYHLHY